MSVNCESLNPIIRNSKDGLEDGTFGCWRSEHGQIILSNNSSDKFSHSIVPDERHESLSEAVIALQKSFPNKYKHPITICSCKVNQLRVTKQCQVPAVKSHCEINDHFHGFEDSEIKAWVYDNYDNVDLKTSFSINFPDDEQVLTEIKEPQELAALCSTPGQPQGLAVRCPSSSKEPQELAVLCSTPGQPQGLVVRCPSTQTGNNKKEDNAEESSSEAFEVTNIGSIEVFQYYNYFSML